jgi:hypothetical protein
MAGQMNVFLTQNKLLWLGETESGFAGESAEGGTRDSQVRAGE